MQYISTRGGQAVDFTTQLLTALASDGGLYLPQRFPKIPLAQQRRWARLPFAQLGTEIARLYTDASWHDALPELMTRAFAHFSSPQIAPLRKLSDGLYLLELFHGPTLAFKDVAMQLLAQMIDHALLRQGRVANIIVATSGDTGAAAVQAFADHARIALFVLYPKGRISQIQRKQMTGCAASNVHILAVDGTFDDCQYLVKSLLQDVALRNRLSLSGVNSINWTRVLAQTIYYFSAWAQQDCPQHIAFSVPTGNFGDIFAGYVAARMGLPIQRLIIASNANDVLVRLLASGVYEPRKVIATLSPAMDIQLPSNFERLLFESNGRDDANLRSLMAKLKAHGRVALPKDSLNTIRQLFIAHAVNEADTRACILAYHKQGIWLDPHTAVGVQAAQSCREDMPMVSLATADAAKFSEAIVAATGQSPPLPHRLIAQLGQEERETFLEPSRPAVQEFLEARCA